MKFDFPDGFEICCKTCLELFWVCRPCYRGQRYCSKICRSHGRRESQRRSRRKHQQSPEGKADHRDRQRSYRNRLIGRVGGFVMDQGIEQVQTLIQTSMELNSARQAFCICCGKSRFVGGDAYAREYKV